MGIPLKQAGWAPCELTLGGMIDAGQLVKAHCNRCGKWREIDLVELAARVGRDYSLIDRRCRCRITEGCDGWNSFSALQAGVWMRPLVSRERSMHWLLTR